MQKVSGVLATISDVHILAGLMLEIEMVGCMRVMLRVTEFNDGRPLLIAPDPNEIEMVSFRVEANAVDLIVILRQVLFTLLS